jgi:DNA (cytosine-5)-methyltransferase 1
MKHYGDITKINGAEVPIVDICCGGSPCQDLSVAGHRKGLSGERSGLFMEQIRIVKEQRDECIRQLRMRGADVDIRHIRPRFMVWENVPGAFSSNKGEDFRCVLEEICRIADQASNVPMPEKGKWSTSGCIMGDGWSVAWRVHDAQFWGVPQRRKRIALVADFGGKSAPEILFERKGMPGDSEQGGTEGQGIARAAETGPDKAISFQERAGCEGGVRESSSKTSESHPSEHNAISQSCGINGERQGVERDVVYCLQGNGIDRADTAGCNGKGWRENQSYTLNTINRPAVCTYQDVTGPLMASGYEKNGTQEAMNGMYVIQEGRSWDGSQVSPTLTANNANGSQRMPDKDNFNAVITISQEAYDKYAESPTSAAIKASGGNYGGGAEALIIQSEPCVQEITKG